MPLDLSPLSAVHKLLFQIQLVPVQGARFQPTGFPSLGAATFQTSGGLGLLVESPQSMANRLEAVCWDEAQCRPKAALDGISYVRVERHGNFLTSSIVEAHRLNSPYIEKADKGAFHAKLKESFAYGEDRPIDRRAFTRALLKYDAASLLHGVFLESIGGRLRIARSLSAFIEADGVRPAVSGGVKNDHVNPSGDTKAGFGNVPFAREEFTAERNFLYVNFDLAQIRGYGLNPAAERLLVVLGLWKLRALLDGALRLRTACDLEPRERRFAALRPEGFLLPSAQDLDVAIKESIAACHGDMVQTTVAYNDDLKKKSKGAADEKSANDVPEDEDA